MRTLLSILTLLFFAMNSCTSDASKKTKSDPPKTYAVGDKKSINSVSVSPDGEWILAGGENKKIKLLRSDNGETAWVSEDQPDAVLSVAISPDGKYFAATCGDNTQNTAQVVVYDMQTKAELWGKKGQTNNIQLVKFTADGKNLMVANHFSIAVYEALTGKQIQFFSGHAPDVVAPYGHVDAVTALSFTQDSTQFISVGWDKNVKIWDIKAGHEIKNFPEADAINACLLMPDGNRIITAGAGDIHVWNKSTDRAEKTISYDQEIKCMAAVDNNQYFATGDVGGNLAVWQMNDFSKAAELRKAHQLGVWSMDVFPGGKSIVTSGGDGSLTVWSLEYLLQNKPTNDSTRQAVPQ